MNCLYHFHFSDMFTIFQSTARDMGIVIVRNPQIAAR